MRLVRGCAVIAAAMLMACKSSPTEPSPTPATITLQSSAWETIADPQPFPISNNGAALTFEFPTAGSIHYLYTASPIRAVHGTLSVTVRVTTSGPVVFNSLDQSSCGIAPSVRPFLWANGNGNGDYDRWWSNPRGFNLADGSATISVPLKPENWSSVNGHYGNLDAQVQFQFDKALLNVSRFGVTFGGGCSFGHGINIRGGTATFSLTDYRIQ
jgi:hypothetical protein